MLIDYIDVCLLTVINAILIKQTNTIQSEHHGSTDI